MVKRCQDLLNKIERKRIGANESFLFVFLLFLFKFYLFVYVCVCLIIIESQKNRSILFQVLFYLHYFSLLGFVGFFCCSFRKRKMKIGLCHTYHLLLNPVGKLPQNGNFTTGSMRPTILTAILPHNS